MNKIKYILVILGVIALETIVIKNNKYKLCVLPPLVAMLALQGASTAGGMGMDAIARNRQNEQNKMLMDAQKKNSLEIMHQQNEYQKEMWERTNASGQVEQLKKAGLNVGLMYGGSGAGGSAQLGSTSGSAGMGSAGGEIKGMDIRQMMDAGLMQSQIELNKAQANKLNTEANKTATVDTEQARETIANIAQSTNNDRLKGILLGYEAQLKEIETNVANMTQEALIRATNANYEKMMQEAIQEILHL